MPVAGNTGADKRTSRMRQRKRTARWMLANAERRFPRQSVEYCSGSQIVNTAKAGSADAERKRAGQKPSESQWFGEIEPTYPETNGDERPPSECRKSRACLRRPIHSASQGTARQPKDGAGGKQHAFPFEAIRSPRAPRQLMPLAIGQQRNGGQRSRPIAARNPIIATST